MTKEEAIEMLYIALGHCEGIKEIQEIGIDPISLQKKLEECGLITSDETLRYKYIFNIVGSLNEYID